MYTRKLTNVALALPIGLGPAYAKPVNPEAAIAEAAYATQYCHLNRPEGQLNIDLNTDKILIDIGAEKLPLPRIDRWWGMGTVH